jgi:hypothetical protein
MKNKTPIPIPDLPQADIQRFWTKVDKNGPLQEINGKTSPCWIWQGTMHDKGYGLFSYKGRSYRAHRISLKLAGVELPLKTTVHPDHLCPNRRCVNPLHLEPVTARENTLRGEGISARNARKTHCKRGHELRREIGAKGYRECPTCLRMEGRLKDGRKGRCSNPALRLATSRRN